MSVSMAENKRLLLLLLSEIPGLADRLEVLAIPETIKAGELSVAFQFICEQLDQDEFPLTVQARGHVFQLGAILDMPEVAGYVADNPEAQCPAT